jgi:hypothetical protein
MFPFHGNSLDFLAAERRDGLAFRRERALGGPFLARFCFDDPFSLRPHRRRTTLFGISTATGSLRVCKTDATVSSSRYTGSSAIGRTVLGRCISGPTGFEHRTVATRVESRRLHLNRQ